jgi:hypothetical protein
MSTCKLQVALSGNITVMSLGDSCQNAGNSGVLLATASSPQATAASPQSEAPEARAQGYAEPRAGCQNTAATTVAFSRRSLGGRNTRWRAVILRTASNIFDTTCAWYRSCCCDPVSALELCIKRSIREMLVPRMRHKRHLCRK